MARLQLMPIGTEMKTPLPAFWEELNEKDQNLDVKRNEVKAGWGEKYQQRVHQKGKRTTHERIAALADSPDQIFPVGTFVNDGEIFGGERGRPSPAAGVITSFVKINGLWTMVIANDNTVASGSWWPQTPEKIIRAQKMALKLRIPVVYLVDCSGLFLPEQSKTFPGATGAGHIFKMNSVLSAAGVPQIAGVFGDCIAGGGYMPIISDKVFMTEQAYMVIAGAALIQGAKSQNLSSLDIGGADVHVHLSACADERVPDDDTCLLRISQEIQKLGSSAADYYRQGFAPQPPSFSSEELNAVIPASGTQPYDVKEVISRLVDDSLFWELLPEFGQEVMVGVGRINGLYVGLIANNQMLSDHPHQQGQKRPGGILYREGVSKISIFSRACNDDGIPVVWLQDISGFDIGTEAEKQGLLGYGSSLIYTNSTNETPMITVLLRKASGAGYYAMSGLPYDPVLQLSTPITRLSVMEGRTLAIGAFNSKLDDNFQIITEDKEEREAIAKGMKEVEDRIEQDMDPFKAAKQMDTDEVVKLSEVRAYLEAAVEMCYQTYGTRRIKNPRIWSLHDLSLATGGLR